MNHERFKFHVSASIPYSDFYFGINFRFYSIHFACAWRERKREKERVEKNVTEMRCYLFMFDVKCKISHFSSFTNHFIFSFVFAKWSILHTRNRFASDPKANSFFEIIFVCVNFIIQVKNRKAKAETFKWPTSMGLHDNASIQCRQVWIGRFVCCHRMGLMGSEYMTNKVFVQHLTATRVHISHGQKIEMIENCRKKALILWLIDDMTIAAGGGL